MESNPAHNTCYTVVPNTTSFARQLQPAHRAISRLALQCGRGRQGLFGHHLDRRLKLDGRRNGRQIRSPGHHAAEKQHAHTYVKAGVSFHLLDTNVKATAPMAVVSQGVWRAQGTLAVVAYLPAQYAVKPRQKTTATMVNETITTTKQYLSLPLQMYSSPPLLEGQQSEGFPQQQLGALLGFRMAL